MCRGGGGGGDSCRLIGGARDILGGVSVIRGSVREEVECILESGVLELDVSLGKGSWVGVLEPGLISFLVERLSSLGSVGAEVSEVVWELRRIFRNGG